MFFWSSLYPVYSSGPILVDTYNMSAKGGRVTTTDIDVLNKLEQLGRLTTDRTEVFNKIMSAKTDISDLTVEELILKDLKVTSGVPIAVFPLLIEVYCLQFSLIA